MPIPNRRKNEDRKSFVSRCMGDEVMKKDYPDTKQRVAICLGESRKTSKGDILTEVQDHLLAGNFIWDDGWDEFVWDFEITEIFDHQDRLEGATESKKKKVKLNKPFRTPDGPKKFSVYVMNDKGNVVKVNFGDPNMEIRRDDPDRRRNFRARHQCDDNPGPKWKARYWSCKFWSKPNVSDLT